jgi:hypothetical protein
MPTSEQDEEIGQPGGLASVSGSDLSRSGWQPIATAPKDGTTIDLWGLPSHQDGSVYTSRITGEVRTRNQGARRVDIIWCQTHKCWRYEKDHHFLNQVEPGLTPSHWMRPPAPPETHP